MGVVCQFVSTILALDKNAETATEYVSVDTSSKMSTFAMESGLNRQDSRTYRLKRICFLRSRLKNRAKF